MDIETFAVPGNGGCFGVGLADATFAWNNETGEITVTGRDGVEMRVLWAPGFTGNPVDGGLEIMSPDGEIVAATGPVYSEVGICRLTDGLVLIESTQGIVP